MLCTCSGLLISLLSAVINRACKTLTNIPPATGDGLSVAGGSRDQYMDSSAWGVSLTAAFSLDGHKINVGHGFLNLEINDLTPLTGRNYTYVGKT